MFEYYLPESGKWRSLDYSTLNKKFYALSDDAKLAIIPDPKDGATYIVNNTGLSGNQLRYDPNFGRLVYQSSSYIYYESVNDTFTKSNVNLRGLPYSVTTSGYETFILSVDYRGRFTYNKIQYSNISATEVVGTTQYTVQLGGIHEMSSVSCQQYGPLALTTNQPNKVLNGIASYPDMPASGNFKFIQSTSARIMYEFITIPMNSRVFKTSYPVGNQMWTSHTSNISSLDIVYAGASKYYGLSNNNIYTSVDAVNWTRVDATIPRTTYFAMSHRDNNLILLQYGGNGVVVISGI